jgi:hypothetical protein
MSSKRLAPRRRPKTTLLYVGSDINPNPYRHPIPLLRQQAAQIVSRDVTPGFIVAELLSVERNRLGKLLNEMLGEADKLALQQLLVREDTLYGLATLKQDAKHFGYYMMLMERQKRTAWLTTPNP